MACCARAVPTILLHVNLLLMVFAGGMLATAARLRWDPSAYVPAREVFPLEYRAGAALLPAAALALLALGHLALVALRCERRSVRRALLFTYAGAMLALLVAQLIAGAWGWWRVQRWLRSPRAAELRHALRMRDHLHPLLQQLAHYHPLPDRLHRLLQEAEEDLPRNGYVFLAASGVLVTLQLAAGALALGAAAARARGRRRWERVPPADTASTTAASTPLSSRRGDSEKVPLRAVYRNGRLVMI